MAQERHYSPRIDRFLVSCLYHEARARGVPMTRLADALLSEALKGTGGWREAAAARSGAGDNDGRGRPAG